MASTPSQQQYVSIQFLACYQDLSLTKSQVYYQQATPDSLNLSYLPLPAGLDFEIELALTSTVKRTRKILTRYATVKAFECAVPSAVAPAIDYYFKTHIASGYLNQMSFNYTTISVIWDTPEGMKCSHMDWPRVGDNQFATKFLEEAMSNRLVGVSVNISWE